jgi:hypothetical protein
MVAIMSCENQIKLGAIFKGVAIALFLVATAGPSLGAETSDRPGYHTLNMSRLADGRGDISDAGTPAFAYKDGFWDVRHQWHPWISDDEMLNFRRQGVVPIHAWNHDRDADFGWQRH